MSLPDVRLAKTADDEPTLAVFNTVGGWAVSVADADAGYVDDIARYSEDRELSLYPLGRETQTPTERALQRKFDICHNLRTDGKGERARTAMFLLAAHSGSHQYIVDAWADKHKLVGRTTQGVHWAMSSACAKFIRNGDMASALHLCEKGVAPVWNVISQTLSGLRTTGTWALTNKAQCSEFIQDVLSRCSSCVICSKRVCRRGPDCNQSIVTGFFSSPGVPPTECMCSCHSYVRAHNSAALAADIGDLKLLRALMLHGFLWTDTCMISFAENKHYNIIRERDTLPGHWDYVRLTDWAIRKENTGVLKLLKELGYAKTISRVLDGEFWPDWV